MKSKILTVLITMISICGFSQTSNSIEFLNLKIDSISKNQEKINLRLDRGGQKLKETAIVSGVGIAVSAIGYGILHIKPKDSFDSKNIQLTGYGLISVGGSFQIISLVHLFTSGNKFQGKHLKVD